MKIKNVKLAGSNVIDGTSYKYYNVTLSNGKTIKMEQNGDTKKFQVGIGRSKSRDANQFASPTLAVDAFEKIEKKKASFVLEYNQDTNILNVNGSYDYEKVTRTDYNRIKNIVLGDSPNRAWSELKKFSFVKKEA